jgi:hypothetical protein
MKGLFHMTQADRVHSTPPTNTPADPTRRHFLSRSAGVAAGGAVLALVTIPLAPASAAPAAALDPANAGPALRAAARVLDDAGEAWKTAKAAFVAEDLKAFKWREANPEPEDRRAKKRYWARWRKDRDQSSIQAKWEAQHEAGGTFSDALVAVARVAPRDMGELVFKACAAIVYEEGDFLELLWRHGAPIAHSVAFDLIRLTVPVQS